MIIRSAILAAALGAAAFATPALAGTTGVTYSDLRLDTPAGQQALDRRIDNAAREMCGITDIRTGTLLQGRKNTQCYNAAKASARKQVAEAMAKDNVRGG